MSDEQLTTPPEFYKKFVQKYPSVGKMYEELGSEVHDLGPLDDKSRAFIKLAISGSSGFGNAFRTHIRKAKSIGITREEMEHLVLLLLPTKGFPTMMKAMYIIENEFSNE